LDKTPYPIVDLKGRRLGYAIIIHQTGVIKENFESKAEKRVERLRLRLEYMQKLWI
jgi:hypothetical protein